MGWSDSGALPESKHRPFTLPKNLLKLDIDPTVKSKIMKLPEDNIG